jgi:hypothetical protein
MGGNGHSVVEAVSLRLLRTVVRGALELTELAIATAAEYGPPSDP